MFNVENEKVKELLFDGNFGLERESLRITPDGKFALTKHPFDESEKHIVYDFCENQVEINTPVYSSAKEANDALYGFTKQVCKKLDSLESNELLWPFSNPPYIDNEKNIPIARHVESAGYQEGYREYLADRYGRYKMALCGIHINYSFSDELLQADFKLSGQADFTQYKNQVYVTLAKRLASYGWLMTVLTAASPLLDGSYIEKGKRGETVFNGMASTRCSELGYWNHFVPVLDYSNISNYVNSIKKYVEDGFIAASTELYYPIRLKPRGKYNLDRMASEGVDHIEIRTIDLNPFEPSGLNIKDLQFAQLLLIWLASTKDQPFDEKDQIQAVSNFKNAAHYDLKTVKIVVPNGEVYSVAQAGINVIGFMKEFYKDYSKDILDILDFEEEKLINPEKRYAWRVRDLLEEKFIEKGLHIAEDLQNSAVK